VTRWFAGDLEQFQSESPTGGQSPKGDRPGHLRWSFGFARNLRNDLGARFHMKHPWCSEKFSRNGYNVWKTERITHLCEPCCSMFGANSTGNLIYLADSPRIPRISGGLSAETQQQWSYTEPIMMVFWLSLIISLYKRVYFIPPTQSPFEHDSIADSFDPLPVPYQTADDVHVGWNS